MDSLGFPSSSFTQNATEKLFLASMTGPVNAKKILIQLASDVSDINAPLLPGHDDKTPLMGAATTGCIDNFVTLLELGAIPPVGMLESAIVGALPQKSSFSLEKSKLLAKHIVCTGIQLDEIYSKQFQRYLDLTFNKLSYKPSKDDVQKAFEPTDKDDSNPLVNKLCRKDVVYDLDFYKLCQQASKLVRWELITLGKKADEIRKRLLSDVTPKVPSFAFLANHKVYIPLAMVEEAMEKEKAAS